MPLEEGRWEVRVQEGSEEELDVVLHTASRWADEYELEPRVFLDDEPVELP